MLLSKEGKTVFKRSILVQGLSAAAAVFAAGAVAQAPTVWDPATAKYDLTDVTQIPGGEGQTSANVDGEISVSANNSVATTPVPYLFQDVRVTNEKTRRGLGIGPTFKEEIQGTEYLEIVTPTGSAQGVSGVWLTNLYCGKDGANTVDCVTGTGGNQLTGEQASVEITHLKPDGSIVCDSFHALGSENLGGTNDNLGDVYVDFGDESGPKVLQMVGARFSTSIPTNAGECSTAPTFEAMPAVSGNEFSVLGFVLDEAINTTECVEGQLCNAVDIPGFQVTIKDSPAGIFTLANSFYYVDPRPYCKPDNPANNDVLPPAGTGVPLDITIESSKFATVSFTIPANMCGIPDLAGIPQIWIQSVVTDLADGQRFIDQLVNVVVENDPVDPLYGCLDPTYVGPKAGNLIINDVFRQPLQGWIPRNDGTELPVLDGAGNPSYVLQDVTNACDGYTGKTKVLSNFVSNLHYVPTTAYPDFRAVISEEITRLEQTVNQTFACITNGQAQSTLSSDVKSVRTKFNQRDYPKTITALNKMAGDIKGSRLSGPLKACTADLDTGVILPPTPADDVEIVPALVFGYLLAQIDHLKYHVNDKLLLKRVDPPL